MSRTRLVHRAILGVGAIATVLLAEPTDASRAIGGATLAAGALAWIAASAGDEREAPQRRGGFHRFARHPRVFAGFLLAAGLVLFAASEEPRGRWVPRTVAPLGILFLFVELLPRADAELRARVAASGGEEGARYLAAVPSFVPWPSGWRPEPAAPPSLARALAPRSIAVLLLVAALALACHARAAWGEWLAPP